MYFSDYSDLLPCFLLTTVRALGKKGTLEEDSDHPSRFVNPYLGVKGPGEKVPVAECPSDKGQPPSASKIYDRMGTSYMINYTKPVGGLTLVSTNPGAGQMTVFSMRKVRNPAKTFIFADHAAYNYYNGDNRGEYWHDSKKIKTGMAFVDGHASFVTIPAPGETTNYPDSDEFSWSP